MQDVRAHTVHEVAPGDAVDLVATTTPAGVRFVVNATVHIGATADAVGVEGVSTTRCNVDLSRRVVVRARALASGPGELVATAEPWRAVQQSVLTRLSATLRQHPLVETVRRATSDPAVHPEVGWIATVRCAAGGRDEAPLRRCAAVPLCC